MLKRFVPEVTPLVPRVWQSQHRPADPALHALGYLSSEIIDAATDDALANVIAPGLSRLLP